MMAAGSAKQPGAFSRNLAIVNRRGLHARASARFVEVAGKYDAVIEVEKDGITVGGTSIMGLMMLAASPGCSITVRAAGPDAEAALDALQKLVSTRFGEDL
jgi:phosphocarrier protein